MSADPYKRIAISRTKEGWLVDDSPVQGLPTIKFPTISTQSTINHAEVLLPMTTLTTKQQSILCTYISLADQHPEYTEAKLRAQLAEIHAVELRELQFLDTAVTQN